MTQSTALAADLNHLGYRQELKRTLRVPDLMVYGLIFMVPIAPFAIFGPVYSASGGMPVAAYLIALVVMAFTAYSYAQMVRAFPLSGSVYNYVGRGIGAPLGFLAGWSIMLDYLLVPGLLGLVAAVSLNFVWPVIPVWAAIVGFIAINTVINLLGIKVTAWFSWIMLIGELAVLALFATIGVRALASGRAQWTWEPLYNPTAISSAGIGILGAGVAIAVLSFLGFDGIAMLAEESRGGARTVRLAMGGALVGAGLLFIAQMWLAAILTPDRAGLLANGDPTGSAFYEAAEFAAGSPWLATVCAVATAIAWGIPDSMVAQVAISRLLYAMARDRQLPGFLRLAKVSRKHSVPRNAILLVAVLSLALGLYMNSLSDGITRLSSMVTVGAMLAFLALHVSVVWYYVGRRRSRNLFAHLLMPLLGGASLVWVMISANVTAQTTGAVWLGIGVVILVVMLVMRRTPKVPTLAQGQPAHAPVHHVAGGRR